MSDELNENEVADVFPTQLNNEKLEYIYIGLLLNNPKAISVYYILHEDCHFQRKDLENIYKSIIFKEGESFAPPAAKEGYTLAVENAKTYEFKREVKEIVASKKYNVELVYRELKKLFVLKKHYLLAPTKKIRDKILEITNYSLFDITSTNIEWEMEHDKIEDLHHIGILYNVNAKLQKLKTTKDGLDSNGADWYIINNLKKEDLTPFAIYSLEKLGYKIS